MCGIAGIVGFGEDRVLESQIESMTERMVSRGPDDSGVFVSRDGRVGLGHRRLSIIDLTPSGHQPMGDPKERIWIAFNGEIYNFRELKKELLKDGVKFKSTSDTEVIIYLYKKYKEKFVEKMEGMWSIALIDLDRDLLFLTRDRFGEKPLYYSIEQGRIIFASQPKAILPVMKSRQINPQAINYYLMFGYIPGPISIWDGINKLPHASILTLPLTTGEKPTIKRYWRPQVREISDNQEDLMKEIRDNLSSSVKSRMIADVPVGAFLSGGLDSSSVVRYMTENSSTKKLHTFSIGFDKDWYDESTFAQIVAEKFGTVHHSLYINSQEARDILEILPEYYDEPFADSSMIPTYAVSKLAREYVTVALTGDGGDELWGGYLAFVLFRYLEIIKKSLPSLAADVASSIGRFLSNRGKYAIRKPGLAYGLMSLEFLKYKHNYQRFAAISGLNLDLFPDTYENFKPYFNSDDWVKNVTNTYMETHLVDDFLVKVDRASMANSLETRCPLLEMNLANLAVSLPSQERIHQTSPLNYQLKYLFRKAMETELPESITSRRKQGFSVPVAHYLINEWGQDFISKLDRLKKRDLLPISSKQIESIIDLNKKQIYDYSGFLFALYYLELWSERWLD